jgi:hypothetical protein
MDSTHRLALATARSALPRDAQQAEVSSSRVPLAHGNVPGYLAGQEVADLVAGVAAEPVVDAAR